MPQNIQIHLITSIITVSISIPNNNRNVKKKLKANFSTLYCLLNRTEYRIDEYSTASKDWLFFYWKEFTCNKHTTHADDNDDDDDHVDGFDD